MKMGRRIPLGGRQPYRDEDDWELAAEITPDPFSEEEHSRPHRRRYDNQREPSREGGSENRSQVKDGGEVQR